VEGRRRHLRRSVRCDEAVAMQASEKLAYITGLTLVVDGGMTSTIMI
jgi:hypothetical protein